MYYCIIPSVITLRVLVEAVAARSAHPLRLEQPAGDGVYLLGCEVVCELARSAACAHPNREVFALDLALLQVLVEKLQLSRLPRALLTHHCRRAASR